MGKTYKMIKTVMLLSALSCCWQSSALDGETEGEGGISRMKPSVQQLESVDRENKYSLEDFPNEILNHICQYFDLKWNQNTLLAFRASCNKFFNIGNNVFKDANKAEHHYPWQENMFLNPSMVYVLNTRMIRILSLYQNIMADNYTSDANRVRFKKLCDQFFKKTSLFSGNFIPVVYVDFLQDNLDCEKPRLRVPSSLVSFLITKRNEKKENIAQRLRDVMEPWKAEYQNEAALYVHFYKFIRKSPPNTWQTLEKEPLFKQLNGSLMMVVNKEVLPFMMSFAYRM